MNERYLKLKQEYDSVGEKISALQKERRDIRSLMEEACTHENLEEIEPDAYLQSIHVDDSVSKFKCRDCFQYFNKQIKK